MNELKWIQNWYLQNCDGDWEHCYGFNISTLDNPGWMVDIDIINTSLENKEFKVLKFERSEHDWIYCDVRDNVFRGNGGPCNLEEIFSIFRNWAEK